jgi:hypothetical protein
MSGLKIFQIVEIICFLTALLWAKRLRNTVFIWSVPYMLIVVFTDVVSGYLDVSINNSNQWLFNLYLPFQHLFFAILFYGALNFTASKRLVIFGAIFFLLFYFINLISLQGFYDFNNYSFVVTSFLMILYSGQTLLRMVKSEKMDSIFNQPFFWVCASCLIYFTGFSVFFAVYFYYKTSDNALNQMQALYHIMTRYIITIHYLLLIVALCLTDERKIYDYYNNC